MPPMEKGKTTGNLMELRYVVPRRQHLLNKKLYRTTSPKRTVLCREEEKEDEVLLLSELAMVSEGDFTAAFA